MGEVKAKKVFSLLVIRRSNLSDQTDEIRHCPHTLFSDSVQYHQFHSRLVLIADETSTTKETGTFAECRSR